ELQSRYQILLDTYLTQRAIEAETMVYIARTMVLPAAVRYQTEVAEAVAAAQAVGRTSRLADSVLPELIRLIEEVETGIAELEAASASLPDNAEQRVAFVLERVDPAMARTRAACDALERLVASDLWPMPTYREMLFVK